MCLFKGKIWKSNVKNIIPRSEVKPRGGTPMRFLIAQSLIYAGSLLYTTPTLRCMRQRDWESSLNATSVNFSATVWPHMVCDIVFN